MAMCRIWVRFDGADRSFFREPKDLEPRLWFRAFDPRGLFHLDARTVKYRCYGAVAGLLIFRELCSGREFWNSQIVVTTITAGRVLRAYVWIENDRGDTVAGGGFHASPPGQPPCFL